MSVNGVRGQKDKTARREHQGDLKKNNRKLPIKNGRGEDRCDTLVPESPLKVRSEIIVRPPSAHVTTSVHVGELGGGREELDLHGLSLLAVPRSCRGHNVGDAGGSPRGSYGRRSASKLAPGTTEEREPIATSSGGSGGAPARRTELGPKKGRRRGDGSPPWLPAEAP